MTLSEFKAWFEGYTEGLETAPTKAQFERIKEKVKEIDGAPITQTVFVNRYPDYYRQYWGQPAWYGTAGYSAGSASGTNCAPVAHQLIGSGSYIWDSHDAMREAGKMEALNG